MSFSLGGSSAKAHPIYGGARYRPELKVILEACSAMWSSDLPKYAQIGLWSSALLLLARLLQGLSVGCEYSPSATYLRRAASEH